MTDLDANDPRLRMRFPKSIVNSAEFTKFVSGGVCAPYKPVVPPVGINTKFLSIGSCFSANLAKSLKSAGLDVADFWMSERLFTTFALKDFILGIRDGSLSDELLDDVPENAAMIDQVRTLLSEGCTIVFTLGLSMCWFNLETNQLVHRIQARTSDELERKGGLGVQRQLENMHEMRPTSIEDNRDNLLQVIEIIKQMNPANKIVLTVSPIPLHFSFSKIPLVTADLISKSTLRLALLEVEAKEIENVYYFPSFEIVRWAAPHFPGVFWGTENTDGDPRHLDPVLIQLIIRMFVEFYFDTPSDLASRI